MNRKDKQAAHILEMSIINDMDMVVLSQERNFIKKIYTEQAPKRTIGVDKIMDALIPTVHERNLLEKRQRKTREEFSKLDMCNGEIRAMCYCLGLDTFL